jgi:type II secretory pathway component PulF
MSVKLAFTPDWNWWIRAGERMALGLDVLAILSPDSGARASKAVRLGLSRVLTGLKQGKALVEAMRAGGMILPMEAWCLLESGERTGRLGEAMSEVGRFLQNRETRRRELTGQLWYPALVGITALAVMGLILLWVIPQMREVGESMGLGEQLPWLTEHIGALYGGALAGSLLLAGTTGLILLMLKRMGRSRQSWGRLEESILEAVPLLGRMRHQIRESRLLKQVATLLRGGLTLPHALELAATGRGNLWEQAELRHLRSRLLTGAGFEAAIADCRLIDRDHAELLHVGQESGQLDTWMSRIADSQAKAVERELSRLTRLLEPLFLFFLSGAVGGLILAYLLPMVRMLEQAGGAFN